jgi:tRNA 5-methylaminomethyl-2-thiouridine biosynthesis bifunctional protein
LFLKELWGEIAVVRTSTCLACTFSADVHVSPPVSVSWNDNNTPSYTIKVGSTHVRNKADIANSEYQKRRIEDMIRSAIELASLENVQIVTIESGLRGTSYDFFPIVGPMVDLQQLAQKYPQRGNGLKLPLDKIPLIPNLWVCTGFGGRGFVTAPYSAWLLSEAILKGQLSILPNNILPFRILYRWLRQHK